MEDDSSTSVWINHLGKANKKMTFRHKRLPTDKPSLAASELRKLTVGEFQQSYSNGDAKHELPLHLKIMVGIGADWHSGFDDDQVDDKRELLYPSRHPPLSEFSTPIKRNHTRKSLNACLQPLSFS